MHDDDNCNNWRCSAWNNPVLYLAAAFVAVFLFLRLGLSIWIFYEKRRQIMAQQHDHRLSSASQDLESNGTVTSNSTDRVHQTEWELESVNGGGEASDCKEGKVSDDKVLVIMAGDDKPTFLATPM
ncbi:protein GLUTAMINE DUMPER 4-like [Rosa rugosa]|uniref:protein GLUTAMINE DUMPER 4-like n=1 Tax=Rosa rugosa TaxID=74645 RepID=UPI002B41205E|nr:protein GLUTAMINE DUMPER 4-like [Rosa rugosa]